MRRKQAFERRLCFAALLAAGVVNPGPLLAQGTEERVRRLEEQLGAVTEELKAIKEYVREERDARAAARGRPDAARALAIHAGDEAAEAKERVTALEQKVEQQGIRARFNEGVTFEDPRGNWSVRVSGRAQLDYRAFWPDEILADTFSLRRARLGASVMLYKDYNIVVEGEYASGNPAGTTAQTLQLTLGYIDLNWFRPRVRFRLGQFKPQIGLEQTLLDLQSDYMERSLTQNLLQNLNYDRGIMVYGAPVPGTWYAASLTNGDGQNLEEKQANLQETTGDGKDLTVRGVVDFAQILGFADSIIHIGGSYKQGGVTNSGAAPFTPASVQTEGRGLVFFSPASFSTPGATFSNVERNFHVAEALLAYGPVKLQGEWWQVDYSFTRWSPGPEADFTRSLKASYVTLMWLITGESYSDAYRDSIPQKIKPRNNFGFGPDSGWGAWEVGLRYSTFDGTDFEQGNPPGTGRLAATAPVITSTNKADAYTAQLKWIPNVYSKFMLDYVRTHFDTNVVAAGKSTSREDAVTLRVQLDF